jgi:hypothetical protein
MFMLEFGRWWYGAGWAHVVRSSGERIRGIALAFSLPILIRTLFAPWRRIISYGNHSFEDSLRAMLDNTISRLVGFGVRLAVMLAAIVLIVLTSLLSAIVIICWPLLPLAGIGLVIRGLLPW